MTIRLSAMFEEHMGRILYNWKMARRRSAASSKRSLKRSRRKKLQKESFKESGSESEAEEEEVSPKTTNRKTNTAQTNGHISDYQLSENSEDDEDEEEEDAKPSTSASQSSSSSEHSAYEPTTPKTRRSEYANKRKVANNSYRKNGSRRKPTSSENTNSDDSDSTKRLRVVRKTNNKLRSRGEVRRASSESDEIRTSSRRRNVKRPRYIEDSDSEPIGVSTRTRRGNDTDNSSDTGIITSVSSRGRVRRLTARAKALLRR